MAGIVQFPRTEIRDLVADICEVDPELVVWDVRGLPFTGAINGRPGWWVELSVSTTRTKGIDEDRLVFDSVAQKNVASQYTYRIYTLTVRVKSNDADTPAFDVLDQIRRGLRSITAKTVYQEVNIAFVDWGASRDLPVAADNRTTTESVMEVQVAWNVTVNPGDNDGNWIETAVPTVDPPFTT